MSTAYLLVAHGSRDPRPQIALDRLTYLVGQFLRPRSAAGKKALIKRHGMATLGSYPGGSLTTVSQDNSSKSPAQVFSASLEAQALPLHQQLVNLARDLIPQGVKKIAIMPLFLLMGVHTCEDLPREIAQAQVLLGNSISIDCLPILGVYPWLPALLDKCFTQYQSQPQAERILLAHGSKRAGGNLAIATVAEKLGARAAYWKGGVSLDTVLGEIKTAGEVVILPYFLFAGGLTDLIRQEQEQLQAVHGQLRLKLGEPLGPQPLLAQLIATELQRFNVF
ncbi:sirohydrochlorin chelatase [Synechocystis sp. FACHB-383]|uniref:sirohydrochlorin chelatase n=1 Tax=Synechocystis sp. FACHB-383 TaxID=2692864 RepID=UPI001F556A00|nr:sirohydrochlorin chelatase [Synechocystis sp. FACHB-383]